MTLKEKGFITAGTLVTFLLAIPFVSTIWLKTLAAPSMYETVDQVPPQEIAVVLGAAAYNPYKISPILQDRLDTAIELLSQNKVKKLLLTGAENEVVAMGNYLKAQGIGDEKILRDPAGINTLASIQNIPEKYQSVIIVTQRFHLPRALFYADHRGLEAIGIVADRREYEKIYEFKKREVLATSKAVLNTLLSLSW